MTTTRLALVALAVLVGFLTIVVTAPRAQLMLRARDPGPRGGLDAAGGPLPGLTRAQMASFAAGRADFLEEEGVGDGLAPLWGLGQRLFFLHDGRTSDLLEAIQAHASAGNARFRASEASGVVAAYNRLTERQKQDMLNFL